MLDGKATQNRFFWVEWIAWHGGAFQPTALGQPKENKQQSDKHPRVAADRGTISNAGNKEIRKIQMLFNKLLACTSYCYICKTILPLLFSICLYFAEYTMLNSYSSGLVFHQVVTACMSSPRLETITPFLPLFLCKLYTFLGLLSYNCGNSKSNIFFLSFPNFNR